jgi:hypothetical protein
MTGILPDNPNAEPPTIPWGPFSMLPAWYLQAKMIKRKGGRPPKPSLAVEYSLTRLDLGGKSDAAYSTLAERHYGVPDPDPNKLSQRAFDKAVDKQELAKAVVKRRLSRARKRARNRPRGILED